MKYDLHSHVTFQNKHIMRINVRNGCVELLKAIYALYRFFGIEGHVALERNPGP